MPKLWKFLSKPNEGTPNIQEYQFSAAEDLEMNSDLEDFIPRTFPDEEIPAEDAGLVPEEPLEEETMLEQELRQRLAWFIGEDGEISSIRFAAKVEGDLLRVTAAAECVEEIGQEVPGTGIIPELHRDTEQP